MENKVEKPMIENVPADVLDDAVKNGKRALTREDLTQSIIDREKAEQMTKSREEIPDGHVRRILNFKDRNYVVGACLEYCKKEGHKKFKDQKKLDQIKKLLAFEATLEYTAEMDDLLEDRILDWTKETEQYKLWKQFKRGLLSSEDVEATKKKYQDLDLEKEPKKPAIRKPELSQEEQRGPVSTFYIPSKLDAWVEEALKIMEWSIVMTEYSVELCEKFNVTE